MIIIKDKYKTDIVHMANYTQNNILIPNSYMLLHSKRLMCHIKRCDSYGWDNSWDKRELHAIDKILKW